MSVEINEGTPPACKCIVEFPRGMSGSGEPNSLRLYAPRRAHVAGCIYTGGIISAKWCLLYYRVMLGGYSMPRKEWSETEGSVRPEYLSLFSFVIKASGGCVWYNANKRSYPRLLSVKRFEFTSVHSKACVHPRGCSFDFENLYWIDRY